MSYPKKSRICITAGDSCGVGPEIILKALPILSSDTRRELFIIGDYEIFKQRSQRFGVPFTIPTIIGFDDPIPENTPLLFIDAKTPDISRAPLGQISPISAQASFAYIRHAVSLCQRSVCDAMVTAPIHKEALHSAKIPFAGHTEMLAGLCNIPQSDVSMAMMLSNKAVIFVTGHLSLLDAIKNIQKETVLRTILRIDSAMKAYGIKNPSIAVSGLNPHAGEAGLFGKEEIRHIAPAISEALNYGVNVQGPFPPDTVFKRVFADEFDAVVSMLHDHGYVALKSRDFENCVQFNIGLPIIRTSVGHGTAFDKAEKGISSCQSLINAVYAALRFAENRQNV